MASAVLPRSVLIAVDDAITREAVSAGLCSKAIAVVEASSGSQVLAVARTTPLHLAILDLELSDMTALDVMATLRAERIAPPWILISKAMTCEIALQAGRQGALCAVSTPAQIEPSVIDALENHRMSGVEWPLVPSPTQLAKPGTLIQRAAGLIVAACGSQSDLPTIKQWAAFVGVSNTQLRDTYYRIEVPPHDARDLMRLLRALWHAGGQASRIHTQLDTRDYRTELALLKRAAIPRSTSSYFISPEQFLTAQTFVDTSQALVAALMEVLAYARASTVAPRTSRGQRRLLAAAPEEV